MTSNNLDFVARCMIGHNTKDIKSLISEVENIQNDIGGVKIVQVTKEDYDALTDKPTNVIYLVSDGDKITLYIGGTEVNVQSDWTQTTITADDYIKNKPTLGTAAAKNATDTYNATGTDVTTGKAVAEALATLPEPMVFKGSLGTGGTITTLPTASSSNKGYVYKVITAGTYASQSAKVGDTFISDGSAWVLIPSGDEPSGTVTNVAVANGGGLTVSGSPITTSGTITVGHSNSVTAKTSSSLKKFTYDAYGHVTGSSDLSTDESNALASGIDSTKVAQITTNKNNILLMQSNHGVLKDDTTLIGADWTLTSLVLEAPVNSTVFMSATLLWGAKAPRGIRICRSNTSPITGVIASIEVSDDNGQISTQGVGVKLNGVNTYYVWAKVKEASTNAPAYLFYDIY